MAAACGSSELTEEIGWIISLPLRIAMGIQNYSLTAE